MIPLYEEYRLIERGDAEINTAWMGIHLLLFFLAFVFGVFGSLSFHVIVNMFDEKCVLYTQLKSLVKDRHSVVYQFMADRSDTETLPVDFLETQWNDDSACYFSLYVPLLSAISGLIWTAMFLMLSSGYEVLSGMQRSYRILPTVFIFSLAMGLLSMYTSFKTQMGLTEFCESVGVFTGAPTCADTLNLITLVYERRIRALYQAIKLAIVSSWLHTCCWLASAVVVVLRILLVVDFHLVRIQVHLKGNLDSMLEQYEKHIHTVYPMSDVSTEEETKKNAKDEEKEDLTVFYNNPKFYDDETLLVNKEEEIESPFLDSNDKEYFEKVLTNQYSPVNRTSTDSPMNLVPDELRKLKRYNKYDGLAPSERYVMKMVDELVDKVLQEPTSTLIDSTDKMRKGTQSLHPIHKDRGVIALKSEKTVPADKLQDNDAIKKYKSSLKNTNTQTNLRYSVQINTESGETLKPTTSEIPPDHSEKLKIASDEPKEIDYNIQSHQSIETLKPTGSNISLEDPNKYTSYLDDIPNDDKTTYSNIKKTKSTPDDIRKSDLAHDTNIKSASSPNITYETQHSLVGKEKNKSPPDVNPEPKVARLDMEKSIPPFYDSHEIKDVFDEMITKPSTSRDTPVLIPGTDDFPDDDVKKIQIPSDDTLVSKTTHFIKDKSKTPSIESFKSEIVLDETKYEDVIDEFNESIIAEPDMEKSVETSKSSPTASLKPETDTAVENQALVKRHSLSIESRVTLKPDDGDGATESRLSDADTTKSRLIDEKTETINADSDMEKSKKPNVGTELDERSIHKSASLNEITMKHASSKEKYEKSPVIEIKTKSAPSIMDRRSSTSPTASLKPETVSAEEKQALKTKLSLSIGSSDTLKPDDDAAADSKLSETEIATSSLADDDTLKSRPSDDDTLKSKPSDDDTTKSKSGEDTTESKIFF